MTKRDIAEYVLGGLQKAGAQQAECRVSDGRTDEMNVAAGEFSLMRTTFNSDLAIKAVKDQRKGSLRINKLDRASLDAAIADCVALAETAAPDECEGIAEKGENKTFSQGAAEPDKAGLYTRVEDFLADCKSSYPKVILEEVIAMFKREETLFANTNGVLFESGEGHYDFQAMFTGKDGDASSSFNGAGATFADLSTPLLELAAVRRLIADAEKQIHTKPLSEKYVGKIILTSDCLADFLQMLASCYVSDGVLIDGTSIWKDLLGTQVADKRLTVSLAPLHPSVVGGERFTADGYESRDYDLIKDGVLSAFMLGRYGAKKTGKPRSLNSSFNLVVAPGTKSMEQIVAETGRGLLVNRFSGGMPGPSGDFSGVAKNSFLIENGQITDAVSETMISGNFAAMLKNLVDISSERTADGARLLPWCCFDGITVSSK